MSKKKISVKGNPSCKTCNGEGIVLIETKTTTPFTGSKETFQFKIYGKCPDCKSTDTKEKEEAI